MVFMLSPVARLCSIIAQGEARAETAALQWAIDHGLRCSGFFRDRSDGAILVGGRFRPALGDRDAAWLGHNALQADAALVMTLGSDLSRETRAILQTLGTHQKPFLHLWPSVPQPGRLAWRFLDRHRVEVLNVIGSAADGEAVESFVRFVLDAAPVPAPS
jgi:hypothetical protein